jgi:hypothetical protein
MLETFRDRVGTPELVPKKVISTMVKVTAKFS